MAPPVGATGSDGGAGSDRRCPRPEPGPDRVWTGSGPGPGRVPAADRQTLTHRCSPRWRPSWAGGNRPGPHFRVLGAAASEESPCPVYTLVGWLVGWLVVCLFACSLRAQGTTGLLDSSGLNPARAGAAELPGRAQLQHRCSTETQQLMSHSILSPRSQHRLCISSGLQRLPFRTEDVSFCSCLWR